MAYKLLVDNEAALTLICDRKTTQRSKHITVHYHFVRERFLDGEFTVEYIISHDNLANICTKALPLQTLGRIIDRIRNSVTE